VGTRIQLLKNTKVITALVATWLAVMTIVGVSTGLGPAATVMLMMSGLLLGVFLLEVKREDRLTGMFKAVRADLNKVDIQLGKLAQANTVERLVNSVGARSERAVVDASRQAALSAVDRSRSEMDRELRRTFRQVEALQNLYAIYSPDLPMPSTRGWAASPDLLLTLVDLVIREEPKLVVECGSGTSTLWLALTMQRFKAPGRIVSLEHDDTFAKSTREVLRMHSANAIADVRYAPLEDYELNGRTYPWYARQAWSDLEAIDLLFVDGPPADTGEHARYPALPLLHDALSQRATVVLDDLIRTDEQQVVRQWLDDHGDLDSQVVQLEKKAAIVRRRQ
jgi:predicted O-methyltransferase YrrM